MTTIDVQGDYIVHAGDHVAFLDENGFTVSGAGARLINAGVISLAGGFEGDPASAIDVSGDGAVFWNRQGGALKVHVAALHSIPVTIHSDHALVRNDGLISINAAPGAGALGLFGGDAGVRIENNGVFDVHADGAARAMMVGVGCEVHNTGLIHSSADVADGLMVEAFDGAAPVGGFQNDGVLRVDGGSIAYALFVDGWQGYQIDNTGRIIATVADDGERSVAVWLPTYMDGQIGIENSGLIRADVAVFGLLLGHGDASIVNSGRIIGDIILTADSVASTSAASETILNTGLIRGDIQLGSADDLYDGSHGRLDGELFGNGGADTLLGGAHAEELWGDGVQAAAVDGADLLNGGGGADTLHGGAGADVFAFSRISDSGWSAPDLIADLESSDVIDLSAIDADKTLHGDQAFHLVAALGGHAGEAALSFDARSGLTRLELDVDGDGRADAVIAMSGDHSDFTRFIL